MGDITEDHTTIWCDMGYITKKLISHGAVLDNIEIDVLMKESREAHLLTVNIKTSVYEAMAQATSAAANVVSVLETLNQIVTRGSRRRLDSMNHAINMVDQHLGVLKHTLTGICNVVGTLEQKMHNIYQNDAAQFIKGSSNNAPRDGFEARISTLTADLDGVRQLTEG